MTKQVINIGEVDFMIKAISVFNNNIDCFFLKNNPLFNILLNEFSNILGNDWLKNIKLYKGNCYIIKNKILKIKLLCFPEKIDYTEEMVETYFRKNFKFTGEGKILNVGIVIQKFIANDIKCNEEDVYSVYKSLRKKGYIWMDAQVGNVKKESKKIYIIDLDYIYKLSEADYSNQSSLSKKFEKRFLTNSK